METNENIIERLHLGWSALGSDSGDPGLPIRVQTHDGDKGTFDIAVTLIDGRWGILAPVDMDTPEADLGTKRIRVERRDYPEFGPALHMSCVDPRHNSSFTKVAADVIGRIGSGSAGEAAIRATIRNFTELMQRERHDQLTLEEEMGVFGELLVLEQLTEQNASAVDHWCAAEHHQDFQGPGGFLEVKTTRNALFNSVTINGLEQLDTSDDRVLHLIALRLERRDDATTMFDIIDRLLAAGTDHDRLWKKLSPRGVLPGDDARRRARGFDMRERRVFRIGDDFPRLTRSSLKGDCVAPGVGDVVYTVDLSTCGECRLDDAAAGAVLDDYSRERDD